MQNQIERRITIHAPRERIYDAISNPDTLVKWFPETIEGTVAVGEQPIFGFGEHGRNQVYIVDSQPHEYFAYRWVPGAEHFVGDVLSVVTTLVEFRISEVQPGVCTVTLIESGFASLPGDMADAAFRQNSGGWDFMLGRLSSFFLPTTASV